VWDVLNPNNNQSIHKRIVIDFCKLIFDPYMTNDSEEKIDLTLEFVVEVNRLAESERKTRGIEQTDEFGIPIKIYFSPGETDISSDKIFELRFKVEQVISQVKFLTQDYLTFRISGFRIKSLRFGKIIEEHNKDLRFKPQISRNSQLLTQESKPFSPASPIKIPG
jgi:hypothetical protein